MGAKTPILGTSHLKMLSTAGLGRETAGAKASGENGLSRYGDGEEARVTQVQ